MRDPKIITSLVGFTPAEWSMIRTTAQTLAASCPRDRIACGTLFLPGRPECYRLTRQTDWAFELRLTDEAELAKTLREESES